MSDFNAKVAPALPLFVVAGRYGKQAELSATANSGANAPSATTWVAKLVQYNPVALPFDYPVNRVFWANGSTITTSNADFGIYSADGALIYKTGSTALSGATSIQYVTPSTKFVLPAGKYYFAYTCDNTTARAATHTGSALAGIMWGLLEETTGSFGLPASMAAATTFARAWGYNGCGVTRTTTGF